MRRMPLQLTKNSISLFILLVSSLSLADIKDPQILTSWLLGQFKLKYGKDETIKLEGLTFKEKKPCQAIVVNNSLSPETSNFQVSLVTKSEVAEFLLNNQSKIINSGGNVTMDFTGVDVSVLNTSADGSGNFFRNIKTTHYKYFNQVSVVINTESKTTYCDFSLPE